LSKAEESTQPFYLDPAHFGYPGVWFVLY